MTDDELYELEKAVTVQVMGWPVFTIEQAMHDFNIPRPHCLEWAVPDGTDALKVFAPPGGMVWFRPARDIGAAWEVVRRLRQLGWSLEIANYGDDWQVELSCGAGPCDKHHTTTEDWHGARSGFHATVEVAICRAAIAACEQVARNKEEHQ